MTYQRISEATLTSPVLPADMLPIARGGDTTARRATVMGLYSAIRRVITFTFRGEVSARSYGIRFYNTLSADLTITGVFVSAGTAPTGADMIIDVNKNGTTIFTTQANRPTISAGANASDTEVPDVTSWVQGEYLTVDIDQVGSTLAGADVVIQIMYGG